jgi:hypothetical protein
MVGYRTMTEITPAIFKHMEHMYDELEDRAAPLDSGDTVGNGNTLRFEGSKVEAFRALKISQGYYSKIFDALTEMGCIEQIQRGSGKQGSIILLHKRPVLDEYAGMYKSRLTRPTQIDILRQRVNDMNRRLAGYDLNDMFLSLHQRLDQLEARLDKIERGR